MTRVWLWKVTANCLAVIGVVLAWPGLHLLNFADVCELRSRNAKGMK